MLLTYHRIFTCFTAKIVFRATGFIHTEPFLLSRKQIVKVSTEVTLLRVKVWVQGLGLPFDSLTQYK